MPEMTQIPLGQLEIGRWYVGRGRNSNIGLWDGEDFVVIAQIGRQISSAPRIWETEPGIKREPYFTDSWGCFQPFRVIDEGVITEPHEETPYANTVQFE